LFVGKQSEKLYSASCVGREVNPLGVITHGQRLFFWECLLIVKLSKRSKTFKNTQDTQISGNNSPEA